MRRLHRYWRPSRCSHSLDSDKQERDTDFFLTLLITPRFCSCYIYAFYMSIECDMKDQIYFALYKYKYYWISQVTCNNISVTDSIHDINDIRNFFNFYDIYKLFNSFFLSEKYSIEYIYFSFTSEKLYVQEFEKIEIICTRIHTTLVRKLILDNFCFYFFLLCKIFYYPLGGNNTLIRD